MVGWRSDTVVQLSDCSSPPHPWQYLRRVAVTNQPGDQVWQLSCLWQATHCACDDCNIECIVSVFSCQLLRDTLLTFTLVSSSLGDRPHRGGQQDPDLGSGGAPLLFLGCLILPLVSARHTTQQLLQPCQQILCPQRPYPCIQDMLASFPFFRLRGSFQSSPLPAVHLQPVLHRTLKCASPAMSCISAEHLFKCLRSQQRRPAISALRHARRVTT